MSNGPEGDTQRRESPVAAKGEGSLWRAFRESRKKRKLVNQTETTERPEASRRGKIARVVGATVVAGSTISAGVLFGLTTGVSADEAARYPFDLDHVELIAASAVGLAGYGAGRKFNPMDKGGIFRPSKIWTKTKRGMANVTAGAAVGGLALVTFNGGVDGMQMSDYIGENNAPVSAEPSSGFFPDDCSGETTITLGRSRDDGNNTIYDVSSAITVTEGIGTYVAATRLFNGVAERNGLRLDDLDNVAFGTALVVPKVCENDGIG